MPLTPAEKNRFLRALEEQKKRSTARPARKSLLEFTRRAWHIIEPGKPFIPGIHIDAMCDHLEAVVRGEIRNLLFNVPPRHAKSTLLNVVFPAWVWIENPTAKFLCTSYGANLSKRDSIRCRYLIESGWYRREFGITWYLADDQNEKMRYRNSAGGERIATSVHGATTGEGADYILCDDAHSAQEIHSETKRKAVIEWWDEVISTRGNDPKTFSRIAGMQRLHEEDLSAHLIANGSYEHLCLPAEYEGDKKKTSIGWSDPRTEIGELLWPARFGPIEIKRLKKDLGSRATAGQLQQRPSPAEGEIVNIAWFRKWRELPPGLTNYTQSWDLSFDATDNSSFCVGQLWACKGADRFLIDQWRGRAKFTGQLAGVREFTAKHPMPGAKLVEKKANGAALIDTLKKEIAGIIPIEPHGSKESRAESVAPMIQSGNVYVPDPDIYSWVGDYLHEWVVFPNGKNDDQVDATSQALTYLTKRANFDFTPGSMTQVSKWKR